MPLVGRDQLAKGQSDTYRNVKLSAGILYTIMIKADEPSVMFDVDVYDENGNRVSTSPIYGSTIGCQVAPRWTGLFTIVVTCVRGFSEYSLVVAP